MMSCCPEELHETCSVLQSYWIVLATEENALLALLPTKRIVPTTSTKIAASITAYSAMSWRPLRRSTVSRGGKTRLSGSSVFALEGEQMKRLEYRYSGNATSHLYLAISLPSSNTTKPNIGKSNCIGWPKRLRV